MDSESAESRVHIRRERLGQLVAESLPGVKDVGHFAERGDLPNRHGGRRPPRFQRTTRGGTIATSLTSCRPPCP